MNPVAAILKNLVVWVSLISMLAVQTTALADPTSDGFAAGQAANPFIQSNINTQSAASNVPGYTTSPPQTSYYGQSNLTGQANVQLASCAGSADPVCQAQVGAMASASTPLPSITGNNPAVAAANNVAQNPSLTLGDLSIYYAGCAAGVGLSATAAANVCPPNQFCLGSNCFNISYANDPDFNQAMSMIEAAREAGVYLDTADMRVFEGEGDSCRKRLLKNCCSTDSAGAQMSNQSMFGVGSHLVFDTLMNSSDRDFVRQGLQALMTDASMDGTFTSYGVTLAVNGTALPAGSVTLVSGDSFVIAFDPFTLVIAIVIYVIMSMTSCSQGEAELALKEGASLCHTVGTYCSSCFRVLGHCVSCIEHTTGSCCYNSLLARLINEQGYAQLGMSWGTGQAPACSGFTIPQLQQLNFGAMNLSAFYASLGPTEPNVSAAQATNTATASNCYYGQGQCP